MAKNMFEARMNEKNFIKAIENNIKNLGVQCSVEDYLIITTSVLEDQKDLEIMKERRKNSQPIPWKKAVAKMETELEDDK